MSTRGLYGFRINGVDKLTYNHCNSHPKYLGNEIIKFIKETSIDEMKEIAKKIILVDRNGLVSSEDKQPYLDIYGEAKSNKGYDDWYDLLRNIQGDLFFYKYQAVKHMCDDRQFIKEGLFCEYAYIINIDNKTLEFYKGGFQDKSGNYLRCRLIKTMKLKDIQISKAENFFY